MTRLGLSIAATGLLRALIARTQIPRDRILLTDWTSVDWQSLTFVGERHEITLRLTGPQAGLAAERLGAGLADAEFAIPGQIVADIAIAGSGKEAADGSVIVNLEALTIAE